MEVNQEIANWALPVVAQHLEPVSGELVLLGITDTLLTDEEMGQKLFRLQSIWDPGQMVIKPVVVPDLVNVETFWQENNIPALVTFVNSRSFLLLDHLGWTTEDLTVFNSPFNEWNNSKKLKELCLDMPGDS